MTDDFIASYGSGAAALLRKRAAHWRRVAQLVSDAVLTRLLRSRANSLEETARQIERPGWSESSRTSANDVGSGPESERRCHSGAKSNAG
jgi:hypothetical protein